MSRRRKSLRRLSRKRRIVSRYSIRSKRRPDRRTVFSSWTKPFVRSASLSRKVIRKKLPALTSSSRPARRSLPTPTPLKLRPLPSRKPCAKVARADRARRAAYFRRVGSGGTYRPQKKRMHTRSC